MCMDVELYQQIRDDALPLQVKINGREYTTSKISLVEHPAARALEVTTLTGLVDYIKTNRDKLPIESLICHVESPRCVRLRSHLAPDTKQRDTYIEAVYEARDELGAYWDAESMLIKLQSCFEDTPDRALLLQYAGNIRSREVQTIGDDGVTQEITAKAGVATVAQVVVKNPVQLRPHRTFPEIGQPESSFVFRVKAGPQFALFAADNGAWSGQAMQSIKKYLEQAVEGLHVIA